MECLDWSQKIRQFNRPDRSKHPIKLLIKLYCTENYGEGKTIRLGYNKLTTLKGVTMVAQSTINTINTVINHKLCENVEINNWDGIAISYAGSIYTKT